MMLPSRKIRVSFIMLSSLYGNHSHKTKETIAIYLFVQLNRNKILNMIQFIIRSEKANEKKKIKKHIWKKK